MTTTPSPAPSLEPPPLTEAPPSPPPVPVTQPPPVTPKENPLRLWPSLALFVIAGDICLFGVSHLGAGFAALAALAALLGVFVSKKQGHLVAGAAFLIPSLACAVLQPGFANVAAILAGFGMLFWTNKTTELAWGLANAVWRVVAAPVYLPVYGARSLGGLAKCDFGTVPNPVKFLRLVWPALIVSLFFVVFIAWGNAVFANAIREVFAGFFDWLGELLRTLSFARFAFWATLFLLGVFILIPAHRCAKNSAAGSFLAERFSAGSDVRRRTIQYVLTLAAVNLIFLLTNTLDVVYLWIRQTPPAGVNTTEYLHNGVYGLIFVTLFAGALLAFVFNHGEKVAGGGALKFLGIAWIAQNVFMLAGVGFRLWLHVDSFCLTPKRVGVGFFLALVLAGFALLLLYILQKKSLRRLVGENVLAVCALFFVLQFCNIDRWCVDSAIARWRENKELKFSYDFFKKVGLPGWRLMHVLATESDAGENEYARRFWSHSKKLRSTKPEEFSWREYSVRTGAESAAFCEKLETPERDMRRNFAHALEFALGSRE